jgi:hypothetical protein
MKSIATYLLVILCIFGIYSQSHGQACIDQKLAIISNSAQNGGLFVVEYQVKRSGPGTSWTLATLSADIVFDTCVLKYEFAANWNAGLSSDSGYSKSASEKFMPHWHSKMLRIFLTAPGVCSSPGNGLPGYDIDSSFAGIVRITFTIINASKPFYLFINNITNQAGIFKNPHNIPSTFEIDNIALSEPEIIIEKPLPVTLSSFTYKISDRNVTLNWITSDEINNKGFEIQRKNSDSPEWKYLGFVKGAGTVQGQTRYQFDDRNPESGQYQYRLKQTDYNGNYTYCELNGTVTIGIPKKFNLSQNYPNPFNPSTKIDYDLPADSRVRLVVYDITGRELKVLLNEYRQAGSYTAVFSAEGISSGFYIYTLTAVSGGNEFSVTKKMTLLK